MKYSRDHARTTITIDKKTGEYLKFIDNFHGGIIWAFYKALGSLEEGYDEEKKKKILDYARKLEEKEKYRKGNKKARIARKAIVIEKSFLRLVNKVAKSAQIKRDFIFMSAIKQERDDSYKLLKYGIHLKKEFLINALEPIQKLLTDQLGNYMGFADSFCETNKIHNTSITYDFDCDGGLSPLKSFDALAEDIRLFKEDISEMESIL